MNEPTVSDLFESLGFGRPGTDIDTAVRWALVELHLRREAMAPPKVGARVKVAMFCDPEGEEANAHLLGQTGEVIKIMGEGADIGETPEDPLFVVKFSDGEEAFFFGEELKKI